MQAATPPSPAGSATPRSVLALVCALAVYAGSVALLDGVGSALGRDMSMLDKHLAVIAFAGLAALSHGEALWAALCVLGFGVYRWYRNGRRMDAAIALSFTSIALVVASMLHAVDAAERRTGLHAQALAAAVNQGDRQRLREVALGCEVFCGFARDSGPLVWLVGNAASDADFNAIGAMLNRGAPRNARSGWLPDRRTPLEAAVDRYATDSNLAPYLLGISRVNFHFTVPRASQVELDAALAHAVQTRTPQALISELLQNGARPPAARPGTVD